MISAEIIADSKNEAGNRITTFIIVIPRIVLAEFNTHRMISRNSASSRAIPFEKMIERVKKNPFIPLEFQKDHKGMQGREYFEGEQKALLEYSWLKSAELAAKQAEKFRAGVTIQKDGETIDTIPVTKQLCNRLLEPFLYHTIICTATEWENFMALRNHPAAEIHIAKVAELMLKAMNKSEPKELKAGEWHIPFGERFDEDRIWEIIEREKGYTKPLGDNDRGISLDVQELMVKIATARCARVSYMNYEGTDDYEKDIKLHDRLAEMGHWSPFEHCARAMDLEGLDLHQRSEISNGMFNTSNGWSGNFRGFIQYRKTFSGENKRDNRLIKK